MHPLKGLGAYRPHKASTSFLMVLLAVVAVAAPAAAQAAPKRIVALTPFGANTLVKLGVEPVGVGQTLGGQDRLSPKLKGVEIVAVPHANEDDIPSLTEYLRTNPDLGLDLGGAQWPHPHLG